MAHRTLVPPLLAVGFLATGLLEAQTTAPYQTLTNTRRSVTNFNVETIRGIALDSTGGRIYALNTHGSTFMYFTNASQSSPAATFRTVNNPSAMALWDDGNGGEFAIIVGGGTHGVVKHDRNTGLIVDFLKLPSEPMDVVIDGDHAYVSCGGAFDLEISAGSDNEPPVYESGGVVVEIDLVDFTEEAKHFIPQARPMFMSVDPAGGAVYVSAHLSGNSTTFEKVDVAEAEQQVVRHVEPSHDVFKISGGNVTVYQSDVGTLLTGHGFAPDGAFWMLAVDSKNDEAFTEPDHKGKFADNLAFRQMGSTRLEISLDTTPTGPAQKPASFPIDIAFFGPFALITGSTSDTVRVYDAVGDLAKTVELPDGAIPRSIVTRADGIWIYGWGTNRIYGFEPTSFFLDPDPSPALVYELGVDPAPAAVKRGRAIWYDADRSLDPISGDAGKVSCNTCHPRGGMDMLGWHLEEDPLDRKDMMVTQSLIGIQDTFPYHWRGERSLRDFNGAFEKLLGGNQLTESQLLDFEAFVFSLQGAANPRQHLDRVLEDGEKVTGVTTPGAEVRGSAIRGQSTYFTDTDALFPFVPVTCVDCHGAESGSNGQITSDISSVLPTQINSDVAHLRQMAHKFFQPTGAVTKVGGGVLQNRTRGGFGFSQDGDNPSIIEFFGTPFFALSGAQRDIKRSDVASFMLQFDEGIAPRAHHAVLFDGSTDHVADVEMMMEQADKGYVDLTLLAYPPAGSASMTPVALWYEPRPIGSSAPALFHSMRPGEAGNFTDTWTSIQAAPANVTRMFIGVPPGNGYRFAADTDNDELSDWADAFAAALDNPDADNDTFPDGYEAMLAATSTVVSPTVHNTRAQIQAADTVDPDVASVQFDHETARIAKYFVTFTEPVCYSVRTERLEAGVWKLYGETSHPSERTQDTIVIHGLEPKQKYRFWLDLEDLAKRTNSVLLPSSPSGGVTDKNVLNNGIDAYVTRNVSMTDLTTGYEVNVDVETLKGNSSLMRVVFQVLQQDPATEEWSRVSNVTGLAGSQVYDSIQFGTGSMSAVWGASAGTTGNVTNPAVPGPFLVSPLIAQGSASAQFDLSGVPAGTHCKVIVLGVMGQTGAAGPVAIVGVFDSGFWQMPMSPIGPQTSPSIATASGREVDFTAN